MGLSDEISKQKAKNRMLKKEGQPPKVYNLVKPDEPADTAPKGNPTGICKRCKKEFEQDFIPERNVYSEWKTCRDCRKILAEEKTKKLKQIENPVNVAKSKYEPYNWQIEAAKAFEEHRFIVLACGNRCG